MSAPIKMLHDRVLVEVGDRALVDPLTGGYVPPADPRKGRARASA